MNQPAHKDEVDFDQVKHKINLIKDNLVECIVGQDALVTQMLTAIFAGGHLLLEGLPGLGKTHLAKAIAKILGIDLKRVQCTPDLMPSDITGSEILMQSKSGGQEFRFRPGPIFANMVLVDEVNRATPKTQSSLLEAMQEHQVTYMGIAHPLTNPFWVVATQNPIELEGTYPLPEAQLDRFMMKLQVDMPDAAALRRMLDISLDEEPSDQVSTQISRQDINSIMDAGRQVFVADHIKQSAVRLILSTHPDHELVCSPANEHIRYGASPRGLQALIKTARVAALIEGNSHVSEQNILSVALPVLRHRILMNINSELSGMRVDQVLSEILELWQKELKVVR